MINSLFQTEVTIKSKMRVLRLEPIDSSFITSFGLSFYYTVSKSLNSEQTTECLTRLYSYFDKVAGLLSMHNLSWYSSNFQTFCTNLEKYSDIISFAAIESNLFLDTIYYIFLGLFCEITRKDFLNPAGVSIYNDFEGITRMCEILGINLKIITNDGDYYVGAGMNLELFQDELGCGVVLNSSKRLKKEKYDQDLESLFACIALPIRHYESLLLLDWIKKYIEQGNQCTPSMEQLFNKISNKQCYHDRKEFTSECQTPHCHFCLFDHIKVQVLDHANCLCGTPISTITAETIINAIEPRFNSKYLCKICGKIFGKKSMISCKSHWACYHCREKVLENCEICMRKYEEDERLLLWNFANENMQLGGNCVSCGGRVREGAGQCRNGCNMCKMCYSNLEKCLGCGEDTGIEKNLAIFCVICEKKIEKAELYLFKCKHPVHLDCLKLSKVQKCCICELEKKSFRAK